jgi:hypothetical protein
MESSTRIEDCVSRFLNVLVYVILLRIGGL